MSYNKIFLKIAFAPNPFVFPMDGSAFSGKKYWVGFNGQEKGEGNILDFGARIYDARLKKWC